MGIYRTLYYGDMKVGTGGRMTIPRDIRMHVGIKDGDTLTVRVEKDAGDGRVQMVVWRRETDDT